MKQQIIEKQFKELSKLQRAKLRKWYKKYEWTAIEGSLDGDGYEEGNYLEPYLTIGQMIEFLGEDWYFQLFDAGDENIGTAGSLSKQYEGELCDALWKAVKECL